MIRYTDLKTTDRQDLKAVLPLGKPFTVLIEPSSLCNFKCIQCYHSLREPSYFTRNRMNMPLERFRRIVDQLLAWPGPRLKVLKLSLYGEPLMNPDFCTMLEVARNAAVAERIETTTNASLLTGRVADCMVRHQLDYARVSIYAADQARHSAITGSGIDIGVIRENLRALQERKREAGSERPFVSCKMLDDYGPGNDQFAAMYEDVCDEVFIDKPHGWIGVDGADFIGKYYGKDVQRALADIQRNSSPRMACPMPFTTMAVRANGDVSPCCVDFIGGTNLGNMDKDCLREIWNSDRWFEFQKMQLENRKGENHSCARCDVYLSDHYTRDNIDGFPVEKLREKP